MESPAAVLVDQLELQPGPATSGLVYWSAEPGENALNLGGRLFGGMLVAHTIVAAGRSSPDFSVHMVQQTFLRAGSTDATLHYEVRTLHTGRTYRTVAIEATQADNVIGHAQVSLTRGAEGPEHAEPAPSITPISEMVNRDEIRNRPAWDRQPVTMLVDEHEHHGSDPDLAFWLRANGELPEDPIIHQAVLGYASDRGLMTVAARPHTDASRLPGSSLNHTIWFHRPLNLARWHSHAMHSPSMASGRGFVRGEIHDETGRHVASTAQQAAFRLPT